MGMSEIPSQEEEKIQEPKNQQEITPESEARGLLLSSTTSKQQLPPTPAPFFRLFVCPAILWTPQEEHQIIFMI